MTWVVKVYNLIFTRGHSRKGTKSEKNCECDLSQSCKDNLSRSTPGLLATRSISLKALCTHAIEITHTHTNIAFHFNKQRVLLFLAETLHLSSHQMVMTFVCMQIVKHGTHTCPAANSPPSHKLQFLIIKFHINIFRRHIKKV